MKEHYGKGFVPRCAKQKKHARTKEERHELQRLIKVGRRMARRTAKQGLKKILPM